MDYENILSYFITILFHELRSIVHPKLSIDFFTHPMFIMKSFAVNQVYGFGKKISVLNLLKLVFHLFQIKSQYNSA